MIGWPKTPKKYPSFNSRVIASAIDLLLIITVAYPVTGWLAAHLFQPIDVSGIVVAQPIAATDHPHASQPSVTVNYDMFIQLLIKNWPQIIFVNGLQLVFIAVYEIFFWIRFSSTPGKMLFRMEIQDVTSGARVTRLQAILRFAGYIISAAFFTLGFIWVLFNRQRRGWYDYIAHTMVVKKTRPKEDNRKLISFETIESLLKGANKRLTIIILAFLFVISWIVFAHH